MVSMPISSMGSSAPYTKTGGCLDCDHFSALGGGEHGALSQCKVGMILWQSKNCLSNTTPKRHRKGCHDDCDDDMFSGQVFGAGSTRWSVD